METLPQGDHIVIGEARDGWIEVIRLEVNCWVPSQALGAAPEVPVVQNDPTPEEPVTNWRYLRQHDELRGKETVSALISSDNTTDLDWPYGEVRLAIHVRKHPQYGQDVIFSVGKGQILCRYDSCAGMISFDGKVERLTLTESADHDPSVVFASHAPAIIRKLQSSKKVVVELPFFQAGNRQFIFQTEGLEWPPK